MVSSAIITGLKYGGTFIAGALAGGFMVQKAFKRALMQNYQQMMGQMDPNAMAALNQQLAGGGANMPGVGNVPVVGNVQGANGLNVVSETPAPPVAPQMNVSRTPIAPLNITASSLRGGNLKV